MIEKCSKVRDCHIVSINATLAGTNQGINYQKSEEIFAFASELKFVVSKQI